MRPSLTAAPTSVDVIDLATASAGVSSPPYIWCTVPIGSLRCGYGAVCPLVMLGRTSAVTADMQRTGQVIRTNLPPAWPVDLDPVRAHLRLQPPPQAAGHDRVRR